MNRQTELVTPETEAKIDALMRKMTVEEKIGQLHQVGPSPVGGFEIPPEELKLMLREKRITREEYERNLAGFCADRHEADVRAGKIGAFLGVRGVERCNRLQRVAVEESRLGIPLLFGLDVVHGLRTIFPIPLAEACCWDESLYERSAAIAAREAAATGISWTFAPMVDVARDARWGRIAEGAGEDTYLTSRFAAAKVRGFQGERLSDPERIAACAKHFVAYGAAVGGRDYDSADMSMQSLWETYMPPFAAAAETGAATFMGAFNDLNGIPCTTNRYLYDTVLRQQWGFNGFVVSDAGAIGECVNHGTAADAADAAGQALLAGMDMDMNSSCYTQHLKALLEAGRIRMEDLDRAVRGILRVKFALGLFEHPYTDESLGETLYLCDSHRAAARDAARRSMVLLKNTGVLPLKNRQRIAVIGELAACPKEMLGTWAAMGRGDEAVDLLTGLKNCGAELIYEPCCTVTGEPDLAALQQVLDSADTVIAAVGEYADMSGEASSLCHIGLPGGQEKMLAAVHEAGKPLVTVLFNGRPLAVPQTVALSDAVLEAWHGGSEAGNAVCDILFGDYNPSGRLTATFPHDAGECPLYYNHVPTGRPTSDIRHSCKYMDAPIRPLFPFGYGLSYTEYVYSDLQVTCCGETLTAAVQVKNVGSVAGEETVQLYVHDVLASRERPVRELKVFTKVLLSPGEERTVLLHLPCSQLGFYNMEMQYVVEPGQFQIYVGHDSTADLSATVSIDGC